MFREAREMIAAASYTLSGTTILNTGLLFSTDGSSFLTTVLWIRTIKWPATTINRSILTIDSLDFTPGWNLNTYK